MSNETNYKSKYEQLKSQFMSSVDTAFRLGYQQGATDAQVESAQMQAQQAQQSQTMQGQEQQPQDQAPDQDSEGSPMEESENSAGSELDQHIEKLESMLGKSDATGDDLKKALKEVKSFKEKIAFQKGQKAIKALGKGMLKPALMSKKVEHNLNSVAKSSLSMQEQIVSDIMKSWEEQEQRAPKGIIDILAAEGLVKKEE